MVTMNIKRIAKHLLMTQWQVNRSFPAVTLGAIENEIKISETLHAGEIRFVVEGTLDGAPLFKDQSAQERALDIFSQLRIWDTEHNNGLLIYLLLADRAVEIVADRGIHAKVGTEEWQKICRKMENDFAQGNFKHGACLGINSITEHLSAHFPIAADDKDELSNKPVVM
jgi:uncharacterized membrane protein